MCIDFVLNNLYKIYDTYTLYIIFMYIQIRPLVWSALAAAVCSGCVDGKWRRASTLLYIDRYYLFVYTRIIFIITVCGIYWIRMASVGRREGTLETISIRTNQIPDEITTIILNDRGTVRTHSTIRGIHWSIEIENTWNYLTIWLRLSKVNRISCLYFIFTRKKKKNNYWEILLWLSVIL